ncbi:MAG: hypothetical protein NVSMB18_01280 [Acetobacteraceae bacterium]
MTPNPAAPATLAPQTNEGRAMADPKTEVAAAYGEGDTEAKSMTDAAKGAAAPSSQADATVPPPNTALPIAGTTETDLARNLQDKAKREAAKP